MEYFSQTFHSLLRRILPASKTRTPVEISKVDAYLNAVYKVLFWDDPKISFITLGVLHVLLWLIVQLELRFYGIVFMVSLIIFLGDWYFERKNLRAVRGPSSDAMRQVGVIFTNCLSVVGALRKENRSCFCVATCGIFLGLTVIARNVPGFVLAYLLLIVIFMGPLVVSRMPPEYLSNVKRVVNAIGTNESLLAESDLLPYIANKDLAEQDGDLDSLLTDKTADSVTSSLISGIMSMPSHLDAEGGSLDGLEEEDLEFTMRNNHAPVVQFAPGEFSSDSDSDHKSMNFESSHFNGDSSSEDENRYAKGLQFAEVNSQEPKDSSSAGILGNITSLGSNLISNVLKTTVLTNVPKRKDSESDFEIIDSDDVEES